MVRQDGFNNELKAVSLKFVKFNDNEPAADIQAKEGYLALSSIVRATAHFVVSDNVANRGCCATLPPHGEVAEWLKALPC